MIIARHAIFSILFLAAGLAAAQEVEVNFADPSSALQGTVQLDVEISGNGFDNSADVSFLVSDTENPGGITVTNVRVRGPKKIIATIDVSPTADVSDFDIEVELRSGRRGKGTTLFRVQENTASPDRIAGCVEFAPGLPITSDGTIPPAIEYLYCDGDEYAENHIGDPGSMQVAMNCKSNHFNVTPGGGSRHIHVDLSASPVPTDISACENSSGVVNVLFRDTTMANVPDCSNTTNPDWGFDHVMRTKPGPVNVCDLAYDQSVQVDMRFQTNLHYRKDNRVPPCNGGFNRCGRSLEGIEINYDDPLLCPPITITCTGTDQNSRCSSWTVVSVGAGCVTHESSSDIISVNLPFMATFTACPDNDCSLLP